MDGERVRAGARKEDINEALGFRRQGGMAGRHYFSKSQWQLPTAGHYKAMQYFLNSDNKVESEYLRREYEDLRREYEDLRREYEDLRPTFNNPGKVSSVWQGPPAKKNGHETPKPEWLLERIIAVTSNEGDVVADFFMGSGTTAVVAKKLGRHYFGCDTNPEYVKMGRQRLACVQRRLF